MTQPLPFGEPEDIFFKRDDGTKIAAHIWKPDGFQPSSTYPALLLGGAVSMVKEQAPDNYAPLFTREGFVALTFDYASYGESEGQPRQNENVASKLADLKACVTLLREQPFVGKIGVVGICTSGGNVAWLGAEDKRISAMASVIPFLSEPAIDDMLWGAKSGWGRDVIAERDAKCVEAKRRFEEDGEYFSTQTFSNTPDVDGFNLGAAEYFFDKWRAYKAPTWRNEVWWGSWNEWTRVYDPIAQAARCELPSLVFSTDDALLPEQAKKFHAALRGEKELVWGDGYHFNFYDLLPNVRQIVNAVVPFMRKHL